MSKPRKLPTMPWPAVPLRSTLGDWAGQTLAIGGKGDLNSPTTALLERAAAQEQVVRILRSLALYYLPDPDHVPLQLTDGR